MQPARGSQRSTDDIDRIAGAVADVVRRSLSTPSTTAGASRDPAPATTFSHVSSLGDRDSSKSATEEHQPTKRKFPAPTAFRKRRKSDQPKLL